MIELLKKLLKFIDFKVEESNNKVEIELNKQRAKLLKQVEDYV